MKDGLTPAEQMAIRYQELVKRYDENCDCKVCSLIKLYVQPDDEDRNPWAELN